MPSLKAYDYEIEDEHSVNGIRMLASTPASHLKRIAEMTTTPDDVLVATFSKSGYLELRSITRVT